MSSRDFVYSKFCEYYKDPSLNIPAPLSVEQREFAYLLFKERFMVRHQRFETIEDFRAVLSKTVPSDVYHSCAYYENPDFDMDKKGWLGADLVFDIDADHIPTSCNKIHDEWKCQKCGFNGKGITPEECPICGGDKFEAKTWPCELCIKSTREETSKLVDMLQNDFGFSSSEMHLFFSGHRGYHVHVEDEAVRSLDSLARKEIVDYVIGLGLDVLDKEATDRRGKKAAEKKFFLHNFGWDKRLKNGMRTFLSSADRAALREIGVVRTAFVLKNKDTILKRCINEGRWDSLNLSVETWRKIAEHVKNVQSANIDTVVTTDIHRLIRMNGTLHGKTGLKKTEFPVSQLETFDPFTQAVAFKKGTAKVQVSEAPEFRLGGETLGPYKNQTVELPTAAAVMLICKGRAEVAN
jgi:DNA primase small subunit